MRVAAVRDCPVLLDRAATLDLVDQLTDQATAHTAQLVVFPEAFVPGPPVRIDALPVAEDAEWHALLMRESVTVPGPACERLAAAARRADAVLVVGAMSARSTAAPSATQVALHRLTPAGHGTRAGREVLCARASQRGKAESPAVLQYEFEFDAEHGMILRCAVSQAGSLVRMTEATAVAYHCSIDTNLFVFAAPDGKPARRVQPAVPALDGVGSPPSFTEQREMLASEPSGV